MSWVRHGLESVVPCCGQLLSLLSAEEVELRVCGQTEVDVALLKRHTTYRDCDEKDAHVQNFWKAFEGALLPGCVCCALPRFADARVFVLLHCSGFSNEDRGRFLQFAWARSRLPVDMSGSPMIMRFKAHAEGQAKTDMMLPKSQTCFFQVDVPRYSTFELMRERLALAILCVDMNA